MPYPPDFNDDLFDAMYANAEDECPEACRRLDNIHLAYEETLKALVDAHIKRGVLLSKDDIEAIMQVVGETHAHEADHPLQELREAGYQDFSYTPDNADKLIAKEAERLADAFRPKRPASSAVFDSLRPLNPATLIATGKLENDA
jgi:hypothetical protein